MTDYLQTVEKAREYWVTHKLGSYDYVLLLPDDNVEQNTHFRNIFTQKLAGRRGIAIDGDTAHCLLSLYSLYAFTDKLIIGSFDMPYGRKLRNLLVTNVASEEILINDVIFGILN